MTKIGWREGLLATTIGLLTSVVNATPLTAQEAVARAARHNPLLQAALHDRQAARHGVTAEQGARLPSAFAAVAAQRNERFNAAREGIVRNEDRLASGQLGVRYRTPIGSDVELGVQLDRTARNTLVTPAGTDVVSIGPNYGGQVQLTLRQPLLRNAGTAGALGPLRQALATQRQAEYEAERAASQLVLDVLVAYWELWYSQRALKVQAAAEELARQQLDQINQRIEVLGTASRADALRFAAELAALREAYVQAQTQLRRRIIDLTWLMGSPAEADGELTATGNPPNAMALAPVSELTAQLVAASPELAAMKAQVEAARLRAQIADNANAPRLDVIASGTMTGVWTQDELPGLALPNGRPAFGAMLGVEFDTPLGTSREYGEAARAHAQWQAAQSRLAALLNALSADIAQSHTEVVQSGERVRLATEAESIASALADAERQRFKLGSATSLDVVLAQQNHRQSELRLLRAVVDRTVAQLHLEHQVGRLLTQHLPAMKGGGPS